MISSKAIMLLITVPITNILLNFAAKNAAKSDGSYLNVLISIPFLLAYLIGTISLIALVAVYHQSINVSQGIVLMGAGSIIGGSVIGMICEKRLLDFPDLFILILITIFYVYRYLK